MAQTGSQLSYEVSAEIVVKPPPFNWPNCTLLTKLYIHVGFTSMYIPSVTLALIIRLYVYIPDVTLNLLHYNNECCNNKAGTYKWN